MSTPFLNDLSVLLPDLDDAGSEILADNLRAAQGLYFAAMLEEAKVFAVVDRLADLFSTGRLPLGRGNAGERLYLYWKHAPIRLSGKDRRNLYSRTFGFPGGDGEAASNREFADLWMRFVAAVSEFGSRPERAEDVRRAGLDLAQNLSTHGYGMAYFAAAELELQIREMIDILSDAEIQSAYGVHDAWAVLERVAVLELGGATSAARYRAMARSGAKLIAWLAAHRRQLTASPGTTLPRPADQDLIDACAAWLAASSAGEGSTERPATGGT